MTKLFVLPLMVATFAGITGSTAVEAKGWGVGPGGSPGFINRPKKRCTKKRPCSPMPELNNFNFGRPMTRGGLRPYPGTQWR